MSVALGAGAVWVGATKIGRSVVLRIDPRTGSVDAVVLPIRNASIDPGSLFRDIRWVTVGEGNVWAVRGGTVYRIDPAAARVTGTVDLPGNEVFQIAAGYGAVWALTFVPATGKQLVRIDPRTLEIEKTTRAPAVPGAGNSNFTGGLAFGDGSIWWNGADTGTVWRVDPPTGAITATIRMTPPIKGFFSFQPYAIAATAGGVWVTVRVPP